MAKTRLTFQAVDKAVGWSATFFFLPAPHSRNCWRAHPLLRRPVEHPAPRRAALRLVATPQDTGLISFEQPPPLPIGFAPRGLSSSCASPCTRQSYTVHRDACSLSPQGRAPRPRAAAPGLGHRQLPCTHIGGVRCYDRRRFLTLIFPLLFKCRSCRSVTEEGRCRSLSTHPQHLRQAP